MKKGLFDKQKDNVDADNLPIISIFGFTEFKVEILLHLLLLLFLLYLSTLSNAYEYRL